MTDLLAIVLAAGEGTRMRSSLPKVLHPVGGLPIIGHVVRAAQDAGATTIALVTGPDHDKIRKTVSGLAPDVRFFDQVERKGTAHAASMARELWQDAEGYIAVVYGDHPLLRGENFQLVTDRLDAGLDVAILGFEPEDPTGYGRLVTDGERLYAIREHKDANEIERAIGLCNACILAFRAEVFRALIDKVHNHNSQAEYYITDLVEMANHANYRVGFAVAPTEDVLGVNDRAQLAYAEAVFQSRRRIEMMRGGVTLLDPATTYFSYDTAIAQDVTVEPSVWFGPGVTVGEGAVIHAFCHFEGATIGPNTQVGPFARLRPGAALGEASKVGNFVEVKNSRIGKGAKLSHLSYIGDADVGAAANIGAGAITSNYDGINKHRTVIGDGVFVGANSSLVAPVTIGDNAYVGSGSVITENVEPDALALGRGRQVNKEGYAPKLRARAEAIKRNKK
ncbi:MAG TPA: bifunctional UDP-N-acetylglucosamine diphosphorylase/glucosamine-1-phosphate N-acetyltransferase GlmU [Arsenicitalea sp.]|nr:bifunctional UDP-N-acetylglucosamine diphosphorylase/glucosamine-1-phosphate N-acetyltransferase GlmU [Arsenicitalea sp.]